MVVLKKVFPVLLLFVLPAAVWCQQGLLQKIDLSDSYRRQQLSGSGMANASFCVRPFDPLIMDSTWHSAAPKFSAQVAYTLQNNSQLPYGYNDGSLYPVSGMQQRMSVGFKLQWKHLTIQLQPEFISAANTTPADLPPDFNEGNYWGRYFFYTLNKIDMPTRFGTASFTKVLPGQSSVSYRFGKMSVGVSSENMWWGPGMRNALVMSNNAPGFAHLTLNTVAPIETKIGSFEGQLIVGKLDSSGIEPPEISRLRPLGVCSGCYEPKRNADRYITGFVISWQPKWLKHLYIGLAQSSYFYDSTGTKTAKLGSMFFRYVMPDDHAEIYGEYGRSNKSANPFTVFGDTIPAGYTLGLRKLFPLRQPNSFIDFSAELTHLALADASLIFDSSNPFGLPNPNTNSWYTNRDVRHGYTNRGQVIGASIGPGSNSQTIAVTWVNGLKRIGLQFERVVHNNDFYYYNYFNGNIGGGTASKYWTDISLSLNSQWNYKQFLFAAAINYVSALNYKWVKLDGGFAGPSSLSDKKNVQLTVSVMYTIPDIRIKIKWKKHKAISKK